MTIIHSHLLTLKIVLYLWNGSIWSNIILLWNDLKKGLERENVPVIHCSGWPIIIWLNRFTRPNIRLGMAWFRDQGLWLQICYGFPIISSSCSLSSEVFALIVTLHCFVPSSCIVFTVHQSFVSVWLYCWSLNGGSASQVSKSNVVRRVVWSPLT